MRKILLSVMMATPLLSSQTWGDIYVLTDEVGNQSFSDSPTDPRYTLFMRTGDPSQPHKPAVFKQEKYAASIMHAAKINLIDASLLRAVIATESNFNAQAVSHKGAQGLMQLMPSISRRFGVNNPFDPEQNVMAGAKYLQSLFYRFDNNLPLALAAYNSGENTVARYGMNIPPYSETNAYVQKVMSLYSSYKAAN